MATIEKTTNEVSLAEFIKSSDDDVFSAWGYAQIKIVRGTVTHVVKVKIQSVPQDVIDEMQRAVPKPPVIDVMLDPTNTDHAAMGVTTRQKGRLPNLADPDFQKAFKEHQDSVTKRIVGMGVHPDEALKNPDGTPAETPEQRYDALARMKLSMSHFADIATAVMRLTSFSDEERQKFF